MQDTPFSEDELTAQRLAGTASRGIAIRSFMPDQHRVFFEELQYVFAAVADTNGWPIATILTGAAGFALSPDAQTMQIAARFLRDDPASLAITIGARIGLLGIDFSTRRRNRVNGVITAYDDVGLTVQVEQSFGNCPKYIHVRDVEKAASTAAKSVEHFIGLPTFAAKIIAKADTFFIASKSRDSILQGRGLDISHRGGKPGFVQLHGDSLTIPDYRGNRYFNTLGNLLGEPRAGIMVIDFTNGSVLQLQGLTEIDWGNKPEPINNTERFWRFNVARGVYRHAALPLRWIE